MKIVLEHSGTEIGLRIANLTRQILEDDLGHQTELAIGDDGQIVLYDDELDEIGRFSGVPTREALRLLLIVNGREEEDKLD